MLHIGDARRDLSRWEVITNAEHRGKPRRYHSCEFPSNDFVTLAALSALRMAHDDGRGDADEMIRGDLASERPGTAERRILCCNIETGLWVLPSQKRGNRDKAERARRKEHSQARPPTCSVELPTYPCGNRLRQRNLFARREIGLPVGNDRDLPAAHT
jgi:hypothetical protein